MRRFGLRNNHWPFAVCVVFALCVPTRACTIFVLTDTNHALFCNNEDWTDNKTRIWFLPAGEGYHGAAYVGFDNGWAQGGLNTEGLAFDWVAGYEEQWQPDSHLPSTRGNSSQRMLETCSTVNEAIEFYRNHSEPAFWRAKILVADKTGASVIIGAKDGRLQVEQERQCRGFGARWLPMEVALATAPEVTPSNGLKILRACRQNDFTKYSNVYDLKSGDIFLRPLPLHDGEVTFNLAAELKKGPHYYDMPRIQEQLTQPLRPLPPSLKRFPLDEFKPIPDNEPKVTARFRKSLGDAIEGKMRSKDYTEAMWEKLAPLQKQIQTDVRRLGDLVSMTLVERTEQNGNRDYRYLLNFQKVTVLQHFALEPQDKIAASEAESLEWKPSAAPAQAPPPGPLVGIGVALGTNGQNVVVTAIVPESPAAEEKRLRVGDTILAVAQADDPAVPLDGAKIAQAPNLIRGPAGTTVRLTVAPAGTDESHSRVLSFVRRELSPLPRWGDSLPLTNGMRAPELEMVNLANGEKQHLSDYSGKVVVLEFCASGSRASETALSELQKYAADYARGKGDVEFITVNVDASKDPAANPSDVEARDSILHAWVGPAGAKAYHVRGIPLACVIDREGRIARAGYVGAVEPMK